MVAASKNATKPEGIKTAPVKHSVTSVLSHLFSRSQATSMRCYRGQSDISWELRPSVMRGLRPEAENQIFSELMVEAPGDFSADRSMFDKLVRAQHYSLPTRLLDVSLNPLVALYFACNEEEHHDKDGVVQTLDLSQDRIKFADSDAVSLICNLARLSDDEREEIFEEFEKVNVWNTSAKSKFNRLKPVKRLTQFVRVEKSYFLDEVNPRDLVRYFFVHPAKNNRRVVAQSGAFIAADLLEYKGVGKSPSFSVTSIRIPKSAKPKILKDLDVLNINSRTMFPEVEFAAKYIKRKWTL